MEKIKTFLLNKWAGNSLFWAWNVVAALFVVVFVTPFIALVSFEQAFAGVMPWDFAGFIYLANITVIASIVLVIVKLRKTPEKILGFFYGLEMPLLFLCILRIAFCREMGPSQVFIFILFILSMTGYAFYIFKPEKISESKGFAPAVGLALRSINLFVIIYLSAILLFYVFPAAWALLKAFFGFAWLGNFFDILIRTKFTILFAVLIWLLFAFFTSTVFIFMPFALAGLYISYFMKSFSGYVKRHNKAAGIAIAGGVIAVCAGTTAFLNIQPQAYAFKLLDKPAVTAAEKAALVKNSSRIRAGLMNAYLASYRYLSPVQENNHIFNMYKYSFAMPDAAATALQGVYNFLAAPFLYNGDAFDTDREKAGELYEKFFDEPIQKAEKNELLHAMNSTWDRGGIEAGLLNINERYVHLDSQEITITAKELYSDVEIHEVYSNRTYEQQEIMYYFDLPPDSVMTGLYLGDSGDKDKRFDYVLAPRGAAQKVYKAEVRRRVDPSLLEQVGPTQYRLRAFPVPVKTFSSFVQVTGTAAVADKLHLWLNYRTMDKTRLLPGLLEKRNVYWDFGTKRTINGKKAGAGKNWMPEKKAKELAGQSAKLPEKISVKIKDNIIVTALKSGKTAGQKSGKLPALDILVDSSYSMAVNRDELYSGLKAISAGSDKCRIFFGPDLVELKSYTDIKGKDIVFFGDAGPADLLSRYAAKGRDKGANIAVFTDDGGYELQKDAFKPIKFGVPVWFVHTGNEKPYAYSDAILETILSSGGTAVQSASGLINALSQKKSKVTGDAGGYEWTAAAGKGTADKTGLEPLAARMYIYKLMGMMNVMRADNLDKMHAIARQYSIVTPYSSMIVLVNDRQRDALKKASAEKDRFNRTVETGKEDLTTPGNPLNVSAVPEPNEWILIVCVILALAVLNGKKMFKAWRKRS
jgi:putative PEP-CTERM system integral membrane protein